MDRMGKVSPRRTAVQAFKTLLIVAVLSVIACGVYAAITGRKRVEPPPGATTDDGKQARR